MAFMSSQSTLGTILSKSLRKKVEVDFEKILFL